jgi:hypothetical protein
MAAASTTLLQPMYATSAGVDTSWMIQPSLRRSAAKPKAALTGEQWHRVAFTIATANVLALH